MFDTDVDSHCLTPKFRQNEKAKNYSHSYSSNCEAGMLGSKEAKRQRSYEARRLGGKKPGSQKARKLGGLKAGRH